jgi:hypothetical protein
MSTRNLAILTFFLFCTSIVVHYKENFRSSSLVEGSYFVKGLDPGNIRKISLKFQKDQEISLSRDQDRFTLNSHKSYPADTSKVNDLIYQIASIQIKEKIGSGYSEEKLKEFGLTNESKKYQVEIFDNKGKRTQAFFVGKKHKSKGHYLIKEGSGEVYLSDGSLWIDNSYKDFIYRSLVDVEKENIDRILIKSGEALQIARKDQEFSLVEPKKEAKKGKIDGYISGLKNVWFDDFFPTSDESVKSVRFDKSVQIKLKNKLTYDLKLGEKGGKYFVKASALASEVPNKVVVDQSAGIEELSEVGNMIEARQTANQYNLEKGAWVYQLDKSNYEKLVKTSSQLM